MDEHAIIRDKLADISNLDKEVILKLGTYGPDKKPLLWHQIHQEGNEATLLCQQVLSQGLGGRQLADWLKDFVRENFSGEERSALQGHIRLLTVEEAGTLPREELAADTIWWLAEQDGNLQSVVREDGTVYLSGYNNRLYQKGIRPAITMDITALYGIMKNK